MISISRVSETINIIETRVHLQLLLTYMIGRTGRIHRRDAEITQNEDINLCALLVLRASAVNFSLSAILRTGVDAWNERSDVSALCVFVGKHVVCHKRIYAKPRRQRYESHPAADYHRIEC